jgi:hypothetical protein
VTVSYTTRQLITRAKTIQQQNGLYKSESFYLTENHLSTEYKSDESHPLKYSDKLNFKVVTSNQEAEQLEAEGFSFRSHPTYFNHNLTLYTRWLDSGAVAFCTFVDKEFAAITWILPSQHTQKAVKAPPVKIYYENHEVYPRGVWVNPKYRELRLYYYTDRNRNRYLLEQGITVTRGVIDYTNKTGKGIANSGGAKVYGTGRLVKVLGFSLWKERHFDKTIQWSEIEKIK